MFVNQPILIKGFISVYLSYFKSITFFSNLLYSTIAKIISITRPINKSSNNQCNYIFFYNLNKQLGFTFMLRLVAFTYNIQLCTYFS